MNNLKFYPGGFPLETETLDFMQSQTKMVSSLAALGGSDTYILSGVKIEGANITDGVIVYKGEILPFKGGAVQTTVAIMEEVDNVVYNADDDGDGLGDSKPAYYKRYAVLGVGGLETFAFSLLKPFIHGVAHEMFTTFFKDVRLPYIGAIADIPKGWELCEVLSGHFPVVYDPSNPEYNQIGKTGGANKVTLTEAQMPKHSHAGKTNSTGEHSHTGNTNQSGGHTHTGSTNRTGAHSHTGNTNNAGSHNHKYKDGYNIQNGVPPHNSQTQYSAEYIGNNFLGNAGSDYNNNYIWTKDRTSNSSGSHVHSLNINAAGTHEHTLNVDTAGVHEHTLNVDEGGKHFHSVTTESKGSGQAHENRPLYKVFALIKYVGV